MNLTKAQNAREETVAAEYRNFVNYQLNKELPKDLQITFIHYDVKIKKKTEKAFPSELFNKVKKMLKRTNFFSVIPNT